jgi:hypothetical protein|tara:strand:- start:576 stop:770 length:195 start_codon:yes stop_codon:yes gene_type:complete
MSNDHFDKKEEEISNIYMSANGEVEGKPDTSDFFSKHIDTIRVVVIVGVALYVWKSGMLSKILK